MEPFEPDMAPIPLEPHLVPAPCSLGELPCLATGTVVLPELGPGMRAGRESLRREAERVVVLPCRDAVSGSWRGCSSVKAQSRAPRRQEAPCTP